MLKSNYIVLLMLVFGITLTSCLKDDEPVPAHQPGAFIEGNIDMGTNYRYQYYFDLENNMLVQQNLKDKWEIGFSCKTDNHAIVLNGASFVKVWCTGETDFAAVTDTIGANWRADDNSGRLDSTGIGEWGTQSGDSIISNGQVYLIDRGYDVDFNTPGFVKMKVLSANATSCTISFCNLDGSGLSTVTMTKDDAYNFIHLSFKNGGTVVNVEPPKADWDVVFSQYTYIYRTVDYPYYPYLVTGILTNRTGVTTAADSVASFGGIAVPDVSDLDFSSNIDIIGYNWKWFDGTNYNVKPQNNYIVRSRNGRYFKIHFTDFYKDGIKGNIVYEFQEL